MDRRCRNWAIVIGINQYDNLTNLNYAKTDAKAVQKFFLDTVGFEEVFLFTDDSSPITKVNPPISTQPTFGRLERFLQAQFEKPLLSAGDNLWFFFAGHGVRHSDRDYLMLADSNPGSVERTALSVNWIIERLRRWNSDNVMLFLDACRSEGSRDGLGIGLEKYQGVITFYSCSATEKAWEIEELQRGSFTHALLEALQLQGERNCATVARLDEYLKRRIPEINQRYKKLRQNPYASAEPATKLNLPILPKFITPYASDLATLKLDAYRAESQRRWEEAMGLWIRVNIAASGTDWDAIDAFGRMTPYLRQVSSDPPPVTSNQGQARSDLEQNAPFTPSDPPPVPLGKGEARRSLEPNAPLIKGGWGDLKTFYFETVTVNRKGDIIRRDNHQARYFTETLPNNVTLDMVYIPGGTFVMGSPEGEGYDSEKPQHRVTVPSFFMGKYTITQAQWRAVCTLPKIKRDLEPDPSHFKRGERPVERVSWLDAEEFCARLSQLVKREYRLPSEAEWEYACRAGTTTPFYFGGTITGDLVNYYASKVYATEPMKTYRKETISVGKFPSNAFGLYDMHGNVWEWCLDNWHENYEGAPMDGSAWLNDNNNYDSKCIRRGGSWNYKPIDCRCAFRGCDFRSRRGNFNYLIGFRVVCGVG